MYSATEIKDILKQHKQELMERFPISSIALFGSVVRDDFTDKSDVDVLVEWKNIDLDYYMDLADFLEKIFQRKVDLATKKWIKPHYWKHIENDVTYV
jgi:uncharacterized protein